MVFHLTSLSNHLLHFVHSFVDLLLTLNGWWIMIILVLLLITLQVLKLLHHTVHVLPYLDLISYHGVKQLLSVHGFLGVWVFSLFCHNARSFRLLVA